LSLDVVTFGEAMVLLVADRPGPIEQAESFAKRTAGAETNVAIGLSRLGLRVGWASRLGADSMGRYLLGAIAAEGIDCSRVECRADERTGMMFKGRVAPGAIGAAADPAIEYHRQGSAASRMGPDDIDVEWLTSARHLHATGIFAALSPTCLATTRRSIELMRAAGRTVSFDPNLRPSLWPSAQKMREVINELAFRSDWVMPGIEEGRLLTGAETPEGIARFYRDRGVAIVVIKLGSDGAYFEGGDRHGRVAGYPVPKIVDTVGAGDGFAVGVISALLEGCDLETAVRRGAWIGARAVQVLGDTEGLPTRAQLAEQPAPPAER
jgi:2-dehydro-3-deoxygluconokinase